MTHDEAIARATAIVGRFGQACVDGGCAVACRVTCQARVRLIAQGIIDGIRDAERERPPARTRPARLVVSR